LVGEHLKPGTLQMIDFTPAFRRYAPAGDADNPLIFADGDAKFDGS
jgi:hypothetical protein